MLAVFGIRHSVAIARPLPLVALSAPLPTCLPVCLPAQTIYAHAHFFFYCLGNSLRPTVQQSALSREFNARAFVLPAAAESKCSLCQAVSLPSLCLPHLSILLLAFWTLGPVPERGTNLVFGLTRSFRANLRQKNTKIKAAFQAPLTRNLAHSKT